MRDTSPGPDKRNEIGRLACLRGACPLGADRAAVRQELVEHLELLGIVTIRERASLRARDQGLVAALSGLFDLQRVVRHQLGGGVDARSGRRRSRPPATVPAGSAALRA